MTIFAYNSMFVSKMPAKETNAYALKVNNEIVPISSKIWWKKDFLESSLIGFSEYLEQEQKTYLQSVLTQKIKNLVTRQFLISRLTVSQVDPMEFITHYLVTAGHPLKAADKVEIVNYKLRFEPTGVYRVDSSIIFIKRSR